jgi:hypothetical protein
MTHICSDKTMNKFLSFLFDSGGCFLGTDIRKILDEAGHSLKSYESVEKLGKAIRILNFQSVIYVDWTPEKYKDKKEYTFIFESCDIDQAYQCLRDIIWQCCEGDCEQYKLYIALYKIYDLLAHEIANEKTKLNYKGGKN